jgi:hypothetical protein
MSVRNTYELSVVPQVENRCFRQYVIVIMENKISKKINGFVLFAYRFNIYIYIKIFT